MRVISQEISFPQRTPHFAVYESVGYACSLGPDMIRLRCEELKDDIFGTTEVALSSDHGETWADAYRWEAGQALPEGTLRRGWSIGLPDPKTGRLVMTGIEGILRSDHALDGMTQYYPVYRVSEDGGRTWTVEERMFQKGDEYSPEHPFAGVWVGRNSLMPANAEIATSDGRILVPCNMTTLGSDSTYFCPPGAHTFTAAAVAIGTWRDDGRLEWDMARPVELPPEKSLRGAIEPTLAEMPDGRILMVMRANDGTVEKVGGRKWHCVSEDGGRTWSQPEHWTYGDGAPFYSPSSISRLLRHSSGAHYWIGNICPEPPELNHPRYPLAVGEVDPESLLLIRDSLFAVDTRKTDDPATLQLSNFNVYEDRRNGDLVLRMTRWDGKVSGGSEPVDASVHLYRIEA